MFDSLVANDVISKLTDGKWTTVKFYSDRWYFAKKDESDDRIVADSVPFVMVFHLLKWNTISQQVTLLLQL